MHYFCISVISAEAGEITIQRAEGYIGKLNSSSTSDGLKLEKKEKEDDNMEQKQMEEKNKEENGRKTDM